MGSITEDIILQKRKIESLDNKVHHHTLIKYCFVKSIFNIRFSEKAKNKFLSEIFYVALSFVNVFVIY